MQSFAVKNLPTAEGDAFLKLFLGLLCCARTGGFTLAGQTWQQNRFKVPAPNICSLSGTTRVVPTLCLLGCSAENFIQALRQLGQRQLNLHNHCNPTSRREHQLFLSHRGETRLPALRPYPSLCRKQRTTKQAK